MKTNIGKRLLSGLLSLAMVLSLVPAMDLTIEAEAAPISSFITMPITIRDYAADGMLFEFNQVGATGTVSTGTSATYTCVVDPSSWSVNSYTGIRVCTYGNTVWTDTSLYWHCVICDSSGNVISVIPSGTTKGSATYGTYYNAMKSGYYSIWAWYSDSNSEAYNAVSGITTGDIVTYSGTTLSVTPKGTGGTYNQADTAGFSLLSTNEGKDYINSLPSDESTTIAGTDLLQNGTWGLTTDPDPISKTLTSGATQQVYGAYIRTDLVQDKLVNGKMVYTRATVDYLADYMSKIMVVPEQNNDGSYNAYFVKGHKLSELGGEDLAAKIRTQVTGGLGTYAEAKAKYDAGTLSSYEGITTWYDAAYFLLHNTFDDSTGYGQTVSSYKSLHLVDKGDGTYVFNSGYDNAVYDYTNGEIYNTQTSTITGAYANGATSPTYVRGNLLPAARFDPLGPSGAKANLGYGMSGDTYGDMISESTADWNEYYDNTNYHLSLEGHAQFIYYYDDNLYFTFTGDDDVYLFINGTRVLDVGAAHSISKVKISLNDVAGLCGLQDGQAYDFDFFYMERHGTAANFGIETNIKIVDPAMLTQKTGYQNGVEVGYNGYVDPLQPVNYCFQLTNNGEAPLKDLEFKDEDIDVSITSSTLGFNSETTISDLLLAVYNADGSVKQYVAKGSLTEEVLKQALADGIAVGERILIHGFKYTIPSGKWVAGNGSTYFHNTVHTTGTAHYQNSATEELHGIADYRVQKQYYTFAGDHFYTLGELASGDDKVNLKENSTITGGITADEILKMIQAGKTTSGASVSATSFDSLKICSASGNTSSNINTRATVSGKTITYSTPVTGTDSFYFLATSGEVTYGPIQVVVYNYGYADNAYVLDYNLPVELNGTSFGLTTNDQLNVDNAYITWKKVSHKVTADEYGDFVLGNSTEDALEACYNGQSLKYTMDDFMSGVDSTEVTIDLRELETEEPDNRTNGVKFAQKVDVVPASVVYYEDDFVGITYVNSETNTDGNVWAEYEGANGKGKEQSADQNSNYGSDPNYTDDSKWGKLQLKQDKLQEDILKLNGLGQLTDEDKATLKEIMKGDKGTGAHSKGSKVKKAFDKYMKELDGTASNGTIHELILSPGSSNAEIMYFDFQGTGFELISRATQDLYAVLSVRVYECKEDGTIDKSGIYYAKTGDWNKDGTSTYRSVPVITQSEGGDAYEVPIIKIENLPYSKYRVALYASNVSEANREIYVDGVRIYEPLNDELEDVYYSTDEADTEFEEIRPLVLDATITYLDLNDGNLTWGTGTTVVEDLGDDETNSIYQAATHGTDGYLESGPNNEIYLDATAAENTGSGSVSLLAFYVTKAEGVEEAARTLQIGAHRKINTTKVQNTDGTTATETGAVYLVYGSTAEAIANGIQNTAGETVNYLAIESGTEQYITIDPANLEFDSTGKALVLVGTNGGENAAANILALTNLKISGYTLSACGDQIINTLNGVVTSELITTGYSLRMLLAAPVVEDEAEDTNPDVSEPEDDLPDYSGSDETESDETESEETEPEGTEPEATEPENTEPEGTEPEETQPEETKPGKPGNNNKPGNESNKPGDENNKPGNGSNKPGNNTKPGKGNDANAVPETTVPVETEPAETEPAQELLVHAAGFLSKQAASGSEVMLYAVVSDNTESLKILDEDGAKVEFTLLDEKAQKNYGLKSADELLNQLRRGDLKKLSKFFQGFAKEMLEGFAGIADDDFDFTTVPENSELMLLKLNIEGESGQKRTFQVFTMDAEGTCSEGHQSVAITVE